MAPKIFHLPTRRLYIGPPMKIGPHRCAVDMLAIGLEEDIQMRRNPDDEQSEIEHFGSFLLPANDTVHFLTSLGPVAFLYFEPESDDKNFILSKTVEERNARQLIPDVLNKVREILRIALVSEMDCRTLALKLEGSLLTPARMQIDPRIEKILDELRTRERTADRLEDFAIRANLSTSRLRHLFMENTGIHFRRYRLWTALAISMGLVIKGKSVTEAALETGFSSSAHFSAAFKNTFGLSISELINSGIQVVRDDEH